MLQRDFWRSDNPQGVRGQVGAYHRTLATYLNSLIQAGFQIEHLREPQATAVEARLPPGYQVIPPFLLLRCIKMQGLETERAN